MKATDYTKTKLNPLAVTRDLRQFDKDTDNIYESVAIISKRANQIAVELKEEFQEHVKDFATHETVNAEEAVENREQIELARFYEQLPKPTILAVNEFQKGETHYQHPAN